MLLCSINLISDSEQKDIFSLTTTGSRHPFKEDDGGQSEEDPGLCMGSKEVIHAYEIEVPDGFS